MGIISFYYLLKFYSKGRYKFTCIMSIEYTNARKNFKLKIKDTLAQRTFGQTNTKASHITKSRK